MQNGLIFGLPVVFDTHSDKIKSGDKVLLTYQGQNIATLTVDSKWMPNKPVEALKCYGTSSIEHPAVQMISMERGKYYIGVYCSTQPVSRATTYFTLLSHAQLCVIQSLDNQVTINAQECCFCSTYTITIARQTLFHVRLGTLHQVLMEEDHGSFAMGKLEHHEPLCRMPIDVAFCFVVFS